MTPSIKRVKQPKHRKQPKQPKQQPKQPKRQPKQQPKQPKQHPKQPKQLPKQHPTPLTSGKLTEAQRMKAYERAEKHLEGLYGFKSDALGLANSLLHEECLDDIIPEGAPKETIQDRLKQLQSIDATGLQMGFGNGHHRQVLVSGWLAIAAIRKRQLEEKAMKAGANADPLVPNASLQIGNPPCPSCWGARIKGKTSHGSV